MNKIEEEFIINELGIRINVDTNELELFVSNKVIIRDGTTGKQDSIFQHVEKKIDAIELSDLLKIAEQIKNCFRMQSIKHPEDNNRVNNFEYHSIKALVYVDSSEEYTQIVISHNDGEEEFDVDSYKLIEFIEEAATLQNFYCTEGIYKSLEDSAIEYLINKIGSPNDDKVYHGFFGLYEKSV